jgi:hypothetical protein
VFNGSYPRWLAPLPGEERKPFGILAVFYRQALPKTCHLDSSSVLLFYKL